MAADGAHVAITYAKGADAAASVVKEIDRAGRKAIAIQADAADADAVRAAVEKAFTTFGRLDVLVNNAGTAIPKPFEEATLEEMDRVIAINVRGVFVATQAALKRMKRGGRVIMIGSAVGERVAAPGLCHTRARREPSRCLRRRWPESRRRRLGGATEGSHSTRPLREGR
jgi:3-oxoacyl-[acyl-carrier protein] reductase